MRVRALTLVLLLAPAIYFGQELNPQALLKTAIDTWPTYNGDYSGRRHSPLNQINSSNVGSLSTAWVYRATNYGAGGFGSVIKSTPLEVNGVLYVTMPDNVWAVDARTGREVGTTSIRRTKADTLANVAWACGVTGCISRLRTAI